MANHETAFNGSALVVDDDPGLRELACVWLEDLGWRTQQAASASDALDKLARQRFDLMFTDIMMPGGMDGFELAGAAVEVQPTLRVFFASASAWGSTQADEPGTIFLHKPYSKRHVEETLRTVLGG
jgi:CheY-like chemotaxis protein